MANTNVPEHPGILQNVSITVTVHSLHLLNNTDLRINVCFMRIVY